MIIKILGTGCAKCDKLYGMVQEIVQEANMDAQIEKVTGLKEITRAGVMLTPALMINEDVKFSGKLPSRDELSKLIMREAGK